MKTENPRCTSIGHFASQVLRRNYFSLVSGTSSRGFYLQPEEDLTLYITDDHFRGPLTINIRGERDPLQDVQTGDMATFDDGELTFSDSSLVIENKNPLVWKPGGPPTRPRIPAPSSAEIVNQATELVPDHPFLPLLDTVTGGKPVPIQGLPGFSDQIIQLSRSLRTCNPSQILSVLDSILGAGPGLTPLGDDLILGLLLAATRTQKYLTWTGDLIHFYHTLLTAAQEKTTRVSWSLLNCAVQGSADERIIRVLDGLLAGREIPNNDLENLMVWGSSSGMAVLAGIMLGLS